MQYPTLAELRLDGIKHCPAINWEVLDGHPEHIVTMQSAIAEAVTALPDYEGLWTKVMGELEAADAESLTGDDPSIAIFALQQIVFRLADELVAAYELEELSKRLEALTEIIS